MDFGNRLRDLRLAASVTQEKLAKVLNVQRPAISGYETKHQQPDFDRLVLIADYFNVTTDYLLGREKSIQSYHSETMVFEHNDNFIRIDDLSEESREKLRDYKKMLLLTEQKKD